MLQLSHGRLALDHFGLEADLVPSNIRRVGDIEGHGHRRHGRVQYVVVAQHDETLATSSTLGTSPWTSGIAGADAAAGGRAASVGSRRLLFAQMADHGSAKVASPSYRAVAARRRTARSPAPWISAQSATSARQVRSERSAGRYKSVPVSTTVMASRGYACRHRCHGAARMRSP